MSKHNARIKLMKNHAHIIKSLSQCCILLVKNTSLIVLCDYYLY